MTLPPALSAAISERIGGTVSNVRPVYGGDINQAARFQVGGADYFVKWNDEAHPAMFPAEAHGLALLAAPGVIRVPAVIVQGDANGPYPAYLVLEWIETGGKGEPGTMERFGEALAALHRQTAQTHGLDRDNFIGRLPQPNAQNPSWTAFYRDQRIGFQVELAKRNGRLTKQRADLLNRLMERLPELLDDATMPPSLLHGDLWGGNYLMDSKGDAVLIDPAVCYGHREMDLAMSELFGGFSSRFYDAYHAAWPLNGYAERRPLYQLYYILVHLNLFGEQYGGQVDSIAAHYVGQK